MNSPSSITAEAAIQQGPLSGLLDHLHTSAQGLTSQEARTRLSDVGPNDPSPLKRDNPVAQALSLFANPLVVILLLAAIVSGVLGDRVDAAIIIGIVLLSVGLNFIQTYRAQTAVATLRAQVAPTATVLRDGRWQEVPRREVVPGDIIRLSAGDLVPADARLIDTQFLHVQEAALTGESMPVEKEATGPVSGSGAHAHNMLWLGTSVANGSARAVVVATGRATAFGDIAARLLARHPETEFDRGTRQFGLFIMRTVFFLVLFVFLAGAVRHHNALQSFLFAVSLAVGLTPENLPMITAVTLGQGAMQLARRKVIVKHLASIENFGSIDILCSDKTGTLTTGQMVLGQHLDPLGQPSDRALLLASLNSAFQTGIKSPLDEAILTRGIRPPTDAASSDPAGGDWKGYRKVDEIPFDFERRRLSVVVDHDGERLLITKGAPEGVLAQTIAYEAEDGQQHLFDATARPRIERVYQQLNEEGFRVLAVAYRPVPPQQAYRPADERELVLAGFLAFNDPPLADALGTLAALRQDGVTVKILTGDSDVVARHVCTQVGLDPGRIVLGDEVVSMTDPALGQVAERTTIFARVSPAQKDRILLALKSRGHVVGYLGDGINDAPSLHAADVGISVAGAVDVAKEAADIILLERSLQVLHQGILEGRKAFGNVMKYLLMGTSSNFGNVFSMAGASVFLPFLPMLPTQILLNNFLYDFAQITIPTDTVDATFVQKPRKWNIAMLRDFMIVLGPLSSAYDFLTFYVLLTVFHASETLFHTGWFVESLATQTLVIFVLRTMGNPLGSRPSPALAATTLLAVLIGMLLPFSRLAGPLGFVPLPGGFFTFLAVVTLTYLLLVEMAKRRLVRRLMV